MAWTWLRTLWRRKNRADWDVVLFTRQGCHLCEQAWEQLVSARQRHGFALRQVDVDENPDLVRQYGECVPVVVINGRVRFRGRINPVLLRRLLEANDRRKPAG